MIIFIEFWAYIIGAIILIGLFAFSSKQVVLLIKEQNKILKENDEIIKSLGKH